MGSVTFVNLTAVGSRELEALVWPISRLSEMSKNPMSKSKSNVNKSRFNCWFLQCTFSLLATPQNHGTEEPRGVYGCTCHFWLIVDIGKIIPNAQRLSSACRNTPLQSSANTKHIPLFRFLIVRDNTSVVYIFNHLDIKIIERQKKHRQEGESIFLFL